MMKAETKTTSLAVVKPSRRWRASQMPRALNGRFQAVPQRPKPAPVPIDWIAIYEWRDCWRAYRHQQEAIRHEARWGGIRTFAIFAAMSAVLVGLLVAGAAAQAGGG